ncbi:MAG: hypothetical protein K0U72_05605 [Gammaproteobacteria bacterium]|nr:hypothetical protein [Gammaproteobacteria bacterium]
MSEMFLLNVYVPRTGNLEIRYATAENLRDEVRKIGRADDCVKFALHLAAWRVSPCTPDRIRSHIIANRPRAAIRMRLIEKGSTVIRQKGSKKVFVVSRDSLSIYFRERPSGIDQRLAT